MPIAGLAEVVSRPGRFLGVHWMNPAPFVPCVEIVPSSRTSQAAVDFAAALVRWVGKTPTLVADAPGFVASRLQYALLLESLRIVEEGVADVARVDEIVRNSFGFRLPFFGPIAAADIAGLDLYLSAFATMERAFGERFAPPQLLVEQVRAGRLGLKSGIGFYQFGEGVGADVARYRDAAYAGLGEMRAHLPPAPLTGPAASGDSSL
jgi:3-hydroxybutyryl-CoA dehydrogenase